MLAMNSARAPSSTRNFLCSAFSSSLPYPCLILANIFDSLSSVFFSNPADIIGTRVRATARLASSEYAIVSPMSTNSCLVIPLVNTIGRNTQTVVSVEAMIAPPTCLAPSMAASLAEAPSSFLMRYIFSITTIELSTSIPTPSASPDKEMMFRVTPEKYMATSAVMILIGMEHAITNVGRRLFKNTSRIITANMAPKIRFCNTEWTIRSMYTP